MSLAIYKPGQGYWTRVLSAIGAAVLVLSGALWLSWEQGASWDQYTKIGVATGVVLVFAFIIYRIMNRPKVVDFMIATESEMKKVNWPTRKEIIGSTWVVIMGTFLFAALLFVIDFIFINLFTAIDIIESTG